MSYAHVDSVDALKEFRTALWKFVETANQCLSESDSDLQRTLNWLEQEARVYWQGQIRRRTQALNLAKESLRAKLSITRRDGSKPSAIEEQKAVNLAQARLKQAEEKLEKVRQYAKQFQREILTYRGQMQRFINTVQSDIPDAVAHLDALVSALEQYTAIEEVRSEAGVAQSAAPVPAMSRPEPAEPVTRAAPLEEPHLDASKQANPPPPAAAPAPSAPADAGTPASRSPTP